MRLIIPMIMTFGVAFACPDDKDKKVSAIKVNQSNGKPISVGGISCSHCVEEVINALKSLDEVKEVYYDAKNDVFYVSIKDGYTFDENRIKSAIEKAGYSYKGIKQIN
ncbi:MAG: heavy-metal-associated domain-containing protein [candidate division WOR-3 bacterium]